LGIGKIHTGYGTFLLHCLCNINYISWVFNYSFAFWYPLFEKKNGYSRKI